MSAREVRFCSNQMPLSRYLSGGVYRYNNINGWVLLTSQLFRDSNYMMGWPFLALDDSHSFR